MSSWHKYAVFTTCRLAAGCSRISYDRVSGDTYYSWPASSYAPVFQYQPHQDKSQGIGVDFDVMDTLDCAV